MNKKTVTFYEVNDGNGLIGKDSKYSFENGQDAIEMAQEFKKDPRSHNPEMTDENVAYWQSKNYTIVCKTVTTEELVII
jgi:hypothetical protein